MGAVHFFSASAGAGITAARFPCFRSGRTGTLVHMQGQAVRLAQTNDGGRSWRITGQPIPVGPGTDGTSVEQLTGSSSQRLWALVGRGRLVATTDGGSHWRVQALPGPAVEVATSAGFVWAMSCPHAASPTSPLACRPELWRASDHSRGWSPLKLPRVTAQGAFNVGFAVASSNVTIVLAEASRRPTGELLTSHDLGLRWTMRRAPRWDHNKCDNPMVPTAAAPQTFWILCLGNGAAGSSTKGLLRSSDAGRTWATVSAASSLTARPRPGSIPLEEPSDLAAGSQARLWLSLTNGLVESNDGGRRWNDVPQAFDRGGWASVADALDASHAWLLAAGAGLWRTDDGLHWRAVGPLNTG
jgi:hypothetical protein